MANVLNKKMCWQCEHVDKEIDRLRRWMTTLDLLKSANCCGCSLPMMQSPHVNLLSLGRYAKWNYPVSGNVLTGHQGEAVAVVCDDCIDAHKLVDTAIEIRGNECFYHPILDLEPVSNQKARNAGSGPRSRVFS